MCACLVGDQMHPTHRGGRAGEGVNVGHVLGKKRGGPQSRANGAVRVPVITPSRSDVFEDTPIAITPHSSDDDVVLYTVDAPHDFKINPFATKTEQAGQVRVRVCASLFAVHFCACAHCRRDVILQVYTCSVIASVAMEVGRWNTGAPCARPRNCTWLLA
jgi:hypothetical protein